MISGSPIRLGLLGAAKITPAAVVKPARETAGVALASVAARDPERARAFARRHGLPHSHQSYAALIADPNIDAIYIALPSVFHAEWAVRALRAGKHVLCEKPLAACEREARWMAGEAAASGRLLTEAFHYRYHPLMARLKQILDAGELGSIRRIQACLCVPLFNPSDIRYRYELGGGAMLDVGCYSINIVRFLTGEEPRVASARARLVRPQVDRFMEGELTFPGGATGRFMASTASIYLWRSSVRIQCDAGELSVFSPFHPHSYHHLIVRGPNGRRLERVPGKTTFHHQLSAFACAIRGGPLPPTHAEDAVANLRVIDAAYVCAGLEPRGQWRDSATLEVPATKSQA